MSEADARESVIENLINHLAGLPSIGRKTAQRLAYHLLSQDSAPVQELARALTEAKARIHPCATCGNYTEREVCRICSSERRQRDLICVVEKPADILAFERSGTFPGVYHVLGGSISPLDGIGPSDLNLARLWERAAERQVELILALNTNAEGEATATYIAQKLQGTSTRISRLARGIPVGSELEYVDELTVQRALEGRVEVG
jgi:recombination protein RecR